MQEAGFDVLLVIDLDRRTMAETMLRIGRHFEGSEIAFFYFTGVGALVNKDIVLQPSDGAPNEPEQPNGLTLNALVAMLREKAKASIVVLDGIPAPAVAAASLTRSVAPLERGKTGAPAAGRILISYSGAVAAPSASNDVGANGIFATVFANAIAQRGIALQQIFREVRRNVREATRGAQLPRTEGDVALDLVLRPEVADPIMSQKRPSLDQIFWSLLKDSADPADLALFQNTFPSSPLGERAAARLIALASNSGAASVGRLTVASQGAADATNSGTADRQSLALGVSGDRAPPIQVRTWPSTLPATPDGLAAMSTSCDAVAGDPDDPMRLSPGMRWGLVNIRLAVRTCFVELARDPGNRRLLYQVGRILDILGLYAPAESFYRDAARAGYSAGFANLAYLYMTGRGRPVDMAAALSYLRAGAELGNLRARTDLGVIYLHGKGVERSTDEALLWLRLAAASGWPNAMDVLANMYLDGIGVDKDLAAAIELFQASAWVGNTNAMTSMGQRFLDGRGVERSTAMAQTWYERAVAAGNAFAPLYLGQMYRDGNGPKRNTARAVELMTLSAERGFGEARFRLAELYEGGRGVRRDPVEAAFNYMLTDHQSFEHPVLPQFVDKAKQRLAPLMSNLTSEQAETVRRRVDEYLKLNGS
nr:caspase family protein [Aureimonas leprariae]